MDKINLVHATPNYALVQLPYKRETAVSLKDVVLCTNVNSDDIADIDNANEESENVNVNLNNDTNGLNIQNKNIEVDTQEKLMIKNYPILFLMLLQKDLLE